VKWHTHPPAISRPFALLLLLLLLLVDDDASECERERKKEGREESARSEDNLLSNQTRNAIKAASPPSGGADFLSLLRPFHACLGGKLSRES